MNQVEYIQRRTLIRPCGIEYMGLNCNYYRGCAHGCKYPCYARLISKERYDRWIQPRVVGNAIDLLEVEIPHLQAQGAFENQEVMLCTMTDPYQPLETRIGLTRHIITAFIENEVPFAILTKSSLVLRDLKLLQEYAACRVGVSLTTLREGFRDAWEPGASKLDERAEVLAIAKDYGIPTWVSCEPIILRASEPLQLIEELHEVVDHWVFGKHNYRQAKAHDWPYVKIRGQIIERCEELGLSYLIKKELLEVNEKEPLTIEHFCEP